jgi:hypothetical protein
MAKRKDNPQNGWFWPPSVWWVPIVVALIGSGAISTQKCQTGFEFTIKVQIKGTNEDISNAKVMLEVMGHAPLDAVTDSNGYARFFMDNDLIDKPGKLTVQATGYKKYLQNIDLNPKRLPGTVQLDAMAGANAKQPESFQYVIKVVKKGTDEEVPDAKVMLEVIGRAPLDAVTDSNGYARVFINNDRAGKAGKLIVQTTGYKKYVRNIDLNPMKLPDVVQLDEIANPTASSTHTEPTASPIIVESPTSANNDLNGKWEITENQQLKQMGRIIINLSEGAPVEIYRQGQKKAFGFVNNNKAFELFPGQYDVKIHQAVVSGAPVERGMDTRIRTGTLKITADRTSWIIYDEYRETKVVFGYGSREIGLPVGKYYIKMNDDYEMIKVEDNTVTEF